MYVCTFSFQKNIQSLNMWYTHFDPADESKSEIFQQHDPIQIKEGRFSLNLTVNTVITLTTMDTGFKGSHPKLPPPFPFPVPYFDDFEGEIPLS